MNKYLEKIALFGFGKKKEAKPKRYYVRDPETKTVYMSDDMKYLPEKFDFSKSSPKLETLSESEAVKLDKHYYGPDKYKSR